MIRTQEEIKQKLDLSKDPFLIEAGVLMSFMSDDTLKGCFGGIEEVIEEGLENLGTATLPPREVIISSLAEAYKEVAKQDEHIRYILAIRFITWIWLDSEEFYKKIKEFVAKREGSFDENTLDIIAEHYGYQIN